MLHISVGKCEKAIDINASDWPCRCHEIANLLLKHYPQKVQGHSRYGKYLGIIAEGSPFYGERPVRHGWIARFRGGIIDPSRWVFENADPYIFVCGAKNPCVVEYDVAGDKFKQSILGVKGIPQHCGIKCPVEWPQSIKAWLRRLFATDKPCRDQVFWLANQPVGLLKPYHKVVYQALIAAGKGGWIPIDNQQVAFNDRY